MRQEPSNRATGETAGRRLPPPSARRQGWRRRRRPARWRPDRRHGCGSCVRARRSGRCRRCAASGLRQGRYCRFAARSACRSRLQASGSRTLPRPSPVSAASAKNPCRARGPRRDAAQDRWRRAGRGFRRRSPRSGRSSGFGPEISINVSSSFAPAHSRGAAALASRSLIASPSPWSGMGVTAMLAAPVASARLR